MIGIDTLVLEGASASAVGTTVDVVSAANRIIGTPTFDLRFVSPEPDVVLRGGLVATAQPLAPGETAQRGRRAWSRRRRRAGDFGSA